MTSTMPANLQNLTHTTLDRVLGAIGADAHSRAVCDFSQAARPRKPSQGELAHAANRSRFYWLQPLFWTSDCSLSKRRRSAIVAASAFARHLHSVGRPDGYLILAPSRWIPPAGAPGDFSPARPSPPRRDPCA